MKSKNLPSGVLLTAISFCLLLSSLTVQAQPENDEPCNAFQIECGQSFSGGNHYATDSGLPAPECSLYGVFEDVFYTFTAYPNIYYIIEVNPTSNYDVVLVAYTGDCNGSLEEISCQNDILGYNTEYITFSVDNVEEVIIQTFNNDIASGNFVISLTCEPLNNFPCEYEDSNIECGETIQGSTAGAFPSGINADCANGSEDDVFYEIGAYVGNSYEITLSGNNIDGVLNVYSGNCTTSSIPLGCSDNIGIGVSETVTFEGNNYAVWIQVYDYYGNDVDFELAVTCTSLTPNDDSENAIPIGCGETLTGSTLYATESDFPDQSCVGGGGSHADVFYSFTAYPGVNYQILNNGIDDGTFYDGILTAYTGTLGVDLVEIACSDEIGNGQEEEINITVFEPTDILLRTFDYSTDGGSFEISMNCSSTQDTPCTALPITCNETLYGSTSGATSSGMTESLCSNSSNGDVFYTFEGIAGAEYEVTVNGDNYDAILIVYSGACDGAFTELACADNGIANGIEEMVTFSVEENTTILIRTLDWNFDGGEFEVNLTCIPENDLCSNATTLMVNEPGDCFFNQVMGTTVGASDESGEPECDGDDSEWPDVFYTFNSGNFNTINLNVNVITQSDLIVEVSAGCDGEVIFCDISNNSAMIDVIPNSDYIVRVAPNTAFGETGTFNICVSGQYDCPEFAVNFGDICDDWNPNTINDVITTDCDCAGESTETGSITGEVDWILACGNRDIQVDVYTAGTSTLLYTFNTSIDQNGDFDLGSGFPAQGYDFYVKVDGNLTNSIHNINLTPGFSHLILGPSIRGDLNNDDGINVTDISILNASFNATTGDPNYNYLADMNCDGAVNIIDVSILNAGFGMVGDQP